MLKLSLLLIVSSVISFGSQKVPPVKTADYVDLGRYLGKWYQIAAIPQFFERKCFSETAADYSLVDGNKIKVYNTCLDKNGILNEATGNAKVADPVSNAKLKVTFLKLGTWIYLIGGDYWILDLDKNYRWVIVGEKTRTYGWILSREPVMSNSDLVLMSEKLKNQGYDTCKLLTARQKSGFQERIPLCQVIEGIRGH